MHFTRGQKAVVRMCHARQLLLCKLPVIVAAETVLLLQRSQAFVKDGKKSHLCLQLLPYSVLLFLLDGPVVCAEMVRLSIPQHFAFLTVALIRSVLYSAIAVAKIFFPLSPSLAALECKGQWCSGNSRSATRVVHRLSLSFSLQI